MPEPRRYGLLSVKEVAAQVRRDQDFVYNEIALQRLAHHKIGGRIFVSQSDLDAYVASRRVRPVIEKRSAR